MKNTKQYSNKYRNITNMIVVDAFQNVQLIFLTDLSFWNVKKEADLHSQKVAS